VAWGLRQCSSRAAGFNVKSEGQWRSLARGNLIQPSGGAPAVPPSASSEPGSDLVLNGATSSEEFFGAHGKVSPAFQKVIDPERALQAHLTLPPSSALLDLLDSLFKVPDGDIIKF
jgi:hypothetical protein